MIEMKEKTTSVRAVNVGLYIRVSDEDQVRTKDGADKPHNSLETQESLGREEVDRRNTMSEKQGIPEQWKIFNVYKDIQSAKNANRPHYEEMVQDIRDGRINVVVFLRLERLSRNVSDFLNFCEIAEQHKCGLLSINERFDTTTPMGRFFMTLIVLLAQFEREQTSTRVKTKMQWRAEHGLRNGGYVLGYDLVPHPEHKSILVINPEEANIIMFIFQTYVGVKSLRMTARKSNESGYRTKRYQSSKKVWHGGMEFSKNTIEGILRNPVYIGKIHHNGDTFDGKQEPIMPVALWNEVQDILEREAPRRNPERERQTRTFLLEGLVYCGKCGAGMTPHYSVPRGEYHFYYRCLNKYKGKNECDMGLIQAEQMEHLVVERVQKLAADPVLLSTAIQCTVTEKNEELQKLRADLTGKVDRKSAVEKEIVNLVEYIKRGQATSTITKRRVDEEIAKLEGEQIELEKFIQELQEQIRLTRKRVVEKDLAKDTLAYFSKVYDTLDEKERRMLIQTFVQRVVYTPERVQIFLYTEPIEPEVVVNALAAGKDVNPCSLRREGWLPG